MHTQTPRVVLQAVLAAVHRVPVPHEGPPEHTLGIVTPQSTVAGSVDGHAGTQWHAPPEHAWPLGQRLPMPHDGPPAHELGMAAPQS